MDWGSVLCIYPSPLDNPSVFPVSSEAKLGQQYQGVKSIQLILVFRQDAWVKEKKQL